MQHAYFYVQHDDSGWRWSLNKNGVSLVSAGHSCSNLSACEHEIAELRYDCSAAFVIGDGAYSAKRAYELRLMPPAGIR